MKSCKECGASATNSAVRCLNCFAELPIEDPRQRAKRVARNRASRERDEALRDLGLKKVKGDLGGIYWE